MRSSFILAAMILPLATAAFARSGSFTGPRGHTTSWQATRGGGSVSGSATGPYGRTVSATGHEYNPNGYVHGYTGSVTGPNGKTVNGAGAYAPGYGGAVVVPGHGGAVVAPGNGAVVWHQPPQ